MLLINVMESMESWKDESYLCTVKAGIRFWFVVCATSFGAPPVSERTR
jgi:hypothetical protein